MMQESVKGTVEHIIFRNEENGYTVLSLRSDGKELTLVGFFQSVSEGESMEAFGSFTSHAAYGEQFKVEKYEIHEPEGKDAVERYLGSGVIKGIGKALASRIVKEFGEDTLHILEEEPERLAEIRGISVKKAREIARQADAQKSKRTAMLFLQQYGVSLALGVKIFSKYGDEMYTILRENPYRLAEDIDGVGFKTADAIAAKIGIARDSEYRIRCGILYVLGLALGEGSVYLPEWELVSRTADLLGIADGYVERQIMSLAIDRKIVIRKHSFDIEVMKKELSACGDVSGTVHQEAGNGIKQSEERRRFDTVRPDCEDEDSVDRFEDGKDRIIYLERYYYLELNTARMLCDLNVRVTADKDADIERRLMRVLAGDRNRQIVLEDEQKQSVICAAKNGVFILTGGPGTGKTTTINQMLRFFESENMVIRLAAPTGRAAKRMKETTGYEASTIHRLLEISQISDEMGENVRFVRNEQNPLEADVVIIDEMSMVDIFLMHALLCALPVGTRLVLVGDTDQLPSVGPGAVLADILKSGVFPSVRLTRIFRQAASSDIIVNAHKINSGCQIPLENRSRDFFFLKRSDPNLIISNIIELVRDKIPGYVDAEPFDIQVLSPMRKGALGVERMNRILQEFLNPPDESKAEKVYGDGKFRVGDKVMQIKNNYQIEWEIRSRRYGMAVEHGKGIFNGDMGTIREINEFANIMTIEFDEGRFVDYPFSDLEELELAYAVTIHKSQGSEYPAVILPLLTGPRMLFSRNLLYTAVTRARKCVMILGREETVRGMITNDMQQRRYTSLDERILEMQELL